MTHGTFFWTTIISYVAVSLIWPEVADPETLSLAFIAVLELGVIYFEFRRFWFFVHRHKAMKL